MRLMKFPNGNMALEFKPPEFQLLLKVLAGFQTVDKEAERHLEQAKQEVAFAMMGATNGNDTIN